MLHRFFWSWLRRWFFRKPGPTSNGQRPTRQPRRLGIEWLEDRAVPAAAVALNQAAFISTSYQALLGRDADAIGQAYWTGQFQAGATPTAVASGILNSTEFANDEVQSLYQSLLRRSASSSDQAYWVAQQQGGASWEQIEARILASDEYVQKSGSTLNSWVTQMFQDVLHRPLASGELNYFQELSSPNVPLETIALQVVTSPEADKLQVLGDYSTILGRDGNTDPAGVQYWTSQLEQGASRTTVLASFLGSGEFNGQINTFLTQNGLTSASGFGASFISQTDKLGVNSTLLNTPSNASIIPLVFQPNQGQTNVAAQFLAQGEGYTTYLTSTGPVLSLTVPTLSSPTSSDGITTSTTTESAVTPAATPMGEVSLGMTLAGANADPVSSVQNELASKTNYFIGPQSNWMTGVANYGAVKYQNVYNGIDLVYQGDGQNLRYDFVLNPGASANQIVMTFPGWNVSVAVDGSLVLFQPQADVTMYVEAPKLSQASGSVYGGFVNLGGGQIGFNVGAYDHSQALLIDPTLVYSTFVGGTGNEVRGNGGVGQVGMVVDVNGNAYVTTNSQSTTFPTEPGSFITSAPNASSSEVVFKLNAAGSALVYSTYLGATSGTSPVDDGGSIAIDGSGDAFVTFTAHGTSAYPTTTSAYLTSAPDTTVAPSNVVVTELNPSGNGIDFSTYLVGQAKATAIALDASDNVYITGQVTNKVLAPTAGVFQNNSSALVASASNSVSLGFVIKLAAGGGSLDYATYLTGSSGSTGSSIAVDSSGDAYIGGNTSSTDFPTVNAIEASLKGTQAGFVSVLKPDASSLIFSTYLDGSMFPSGTNQAITGVAALALDSSNNIYVTGTTNASDFPITTGAFQTSFGSGGQDAFVLKIRANSSGSSLLYSTFLSGTGQSHGNAITVDGAGNALVGGQTDSGDFPTVNPIESPAGSGTGPRVGFVVAFNSTGTMLTFGTIIGGSGPDSVDAVAIDGSANVYVAGDTSSTSGSSNTDFPVTTGAFQTQNAGGVDVFVAKLSGVSNNPPPPPPLPPPPPGSPPPPPAGSSSGKPYQIIVSSTDVYSKLNTTSDKAHDFGSLDTVTIFSYDNLEITTDTDGQYEWFKWEASANGTFYATETTISGGPLEMHLFELPNGVLTQLSSNTGGTLSTSLTQGQAVYIEVKGENTAPGVKSTGTYNLDVALEPN